MQKIVIILVLASIASLAGCSSNDDSDSDGNNGIPTAGTLDDVVSRPADSRPVDDGLDQVNADLLRIFGDENSIPVALDENETVTSFVAKQRTAR
jgi:hypothetical protein